jgi:GT2 family glycosyltransferase
MDNSPLISIIIPALHRPDLTAKCVESIGRQCGQGDALEIIIVENAAEPGRLYQNAAGVAKVRSLLLEDNLGTTGSINRALATTTARYVLLLNNDVELEPNFVSALRKALDESPQLAFATGKLLQGREPGRVDGAGDALLAGGGAYRLGHGDRDAGQFQHARSVLSGCGAATLYRRSVLDELGGLDEQLFAYLDDIDLGLRACLHGYEGRYIPHAVATHLGSATLGDPFHPNIVSWITRNQLLTVIKNYPGGALVRLVPRIVLYQLLWGTRVARQGALLPYLKGLLEAIWGLPTALKERRTRQRRRKVSRSQFVQAVCKSERQIYDWHSAQEPGRRSRLLAAYFRIFVPPKR